MEHHRRFDPGNVGRRGLASIERHRRGQVRTHAHCQVVGHASAETEAHHAQFAGAIGAVLQPAGSGFQVVGHFVAVHLPEFPRALFVGARVAAHAGKPIRCEGQEILRAQAAGDVFDIGVEPAVFVHHQHARQLARGIGRLHEQAFDAARTLRGRHGDDLGLDALVVLRHLLRPRVVRPQHFKQGRGRHAADGKLLRALQKIAALNLAVDILVEQVEQFLRKVAGFHPFHDRFSLPP